MPRHAATDSGSDDRLRRGDACVFCRKRRKRCTAERPACALCRQHQHECVYEPPISRVKQLEDQLAQLQGVEHAPPISRTAPAAKPHLNDDSLPDANSSDWFLPFLDPSIASLIADVSSGPLLTHGSASSEIPDYPTRMGDDSEILSSWHDPADLHEAVRNHLIDLFFAQVGFLRQGIDHARFRTRLALSQVKRPHPALVYSMYLLGSKCSRYPSVRVLEPHLTRMALKHIEEGQSRNDRLFDVVRACAFLAIYYYNVAQVHQGFLMAGRAARLCISCGLHAIPSSNLIPIQEDDDAPGLTRKRLWMIPPAEDALELGERIWTFWTIYLIDRAGAIAPMLPCAVTFEAISTPLPHPLSDYGSALEDREIASTWGASRPDSRAVLLLEAITVLDRAVNLIHINPEAVGDNPHTRTPTAYWEVKRALESLQKSCEIRIDWVQAGLDNPTDHALYFLIGCSWMFLWDDNSMNTPNDLAIGCARRMVSAVTTVVFGSELDGIIIMVWSFMLQILVREVKRLHALGDGLTAAPIEVDIDTVVMMMRAGGQTLRLASSQAEGAAEYNRHIVINAE